MLLNAAIAILIILGLLAGWLAVQHLARAFAARHPEFGPAREEGIGCLFCLCGRRGECERRNAETLHPTNDSGEKP